MTEPNLDSFLDALKDSLPLASYLESEGVALARAGNLHKACCPFHGEGTPSFFVWSDDHYHCYGCGAHGDIIDFYLARHGGDWWDAVCDLAKQAGVPIPERTAEQQQQAEEQRVFQGTLAEYVAQCHKALLAHEETMEYLAGRGLTLETIQQRQIGLAIVPTKDPKLLSIQGRIVFPVIRGGKVVNLVGRDRSGKNDPKYKNLPGIEIVPFDSHLLRGKQVILCEGVIDALLLQQAGYPAVATIGCHLKANALAWCGKDTVFALCYDADDAGTKATRTNGALLAGAEREVSVITLPEGMDPADAVTRLDAGALAGMVESAKSLAIWEIERINPGLKGNPLASELRSRVYPVMGGSYGESECINLIAARFKVSKEIARGDINDWKKSGAQKSQCASSSQEEKSLTPRRSEDNPKWFTPSQSFSGGIGVYTVYMPVESVTDMFPFMVTSDRRLIQFTANEVLSLGLVYRQNQFPTQEVPRWPVGTKYPYSVYAWVDGVANADPAKLYNCVRDLLKKHIFFPDESGAVYDLITLWALGTYAYQMFPSYPYLHVQAIQGSGKSTLLQILEAVCFNGNFSESWTESTISRLVNSDCATVIIDEAETYTRKSQDDSSSIFEVLKGGYKRGASSRKAGSKAQNFRPERFDTYSPKVFGGTKPLETILGARCIDVPIEKSRKALPPWLPEEIDAELQSLRGHCYCWGLQEWPEIQAAQAGISPPEGWMNRAWELWKPLVILAGHFGQHLGEPLVERLLPLAQRLREQKVAREKDGDENTRLMGVIVEFIRDEIERPVTLKAEGRQEETEGWYATETIAQFVTDRMGWREKCTPHRLRDILCDALKVADRAEKGRTQPIGYARAVRCTRLTKERVAVKAHELFGFTEAELGEDLARFIRPHEDPFATSATSATSLEIDREGREWAAGEWPDDDESPVEWPSGT